MFAAGALVFGIVVGWVTYRTVRSDGATSGPKVLKFDAGGQQKITESWTLGQSAKGSISIEGISLTVAKLEGLRLTIAIIPHTIKMTNLGSLKPGDPVNIETDIVAKYLEKWTRREEGNPLTVDRLVAQGF